MNKNIQVFVLIVIILGSFGVLFHEIFTNGVPGVSNQAQVGR